MANGLWAGLVCLGGWEPGFITPMDRVYITHGFTGLGTIGTYPNPVDPMGWVFCPLKDPWVRKLIQTHALIE